MGNCLVLLQENVVRVMKTDGKILEYKALIKVEQVLIDFSGHAGYASEWRRFNEQDVITSSARVIME